TPLHVEIDNQRLVLAGQEGLTLVALRDDAALEAAHIVDPQRPLQVQTGTVIRALDLAELHADRGLGFAHLEQRLPYQYHADEHEQEYAGGARHHRTPLVRPSTVTVGSSSVAGGALVGALRAALRSSNLSSGR